MPASSPAARRLQTAALVTTGVGTYAIAVAQGSLAAANYNFAFVDGALSVTPATLTGTADNKSRLYGETNPVFTITYTGFVNSENAGIVTGTLLSSTIAETNSPVGNYPITVSGQSAPNYTINYVAGTLSVNRLRYWSRLTIRAGLTVRPILFSVRLSVGWSMVKRIAFWKGRWLSTRSLRRTARLEAIRLASAG